MLFLLKMFEPLHQKTNNLHYAKTKAQISCAVNAQLICAFLFFTLRKHVHVIYTGFKVVKNENFQ